MFLPVLGDCRMQTGEMICARRSYMQRGGNALGYSFLILMIGAGMLAVGSAQDSTYRRVFLFAGWEHYPVHLRDSSGMGFWNCFRAGGVAAAGIGSVDKLQQD